VHAVVFDIDGTLLQSASADDAMYKTALESILGPVKFRSQWSDYECVTDAGILAQILEDNSVEHDRELIAKIKARFLSGVQYHISTFEPFKEIPGAKKFIERLRASAHHSVAIATGGWRDTAKLKLESSGFDINGLPIATSDDAVDRAEIMRCALARLDENVTSVTYYGDGIWDRAACEALGWSFIAVGPVLGGLDEYDIASVA
jgi:phosphoglycolate phosphatase-like HAD superfamily hydrolase